MGQLEELVVRERGQLTGGDVHTSGRLLEEYVQLLLSHVRSGGMAAGSVVVLDVSVCVCVCEREREREREREGKDVLSNVGVRDGG